MRNIFWSIAILANTIILLLTYSVHFQYIYCLIFTLPLTILGIYDIFQPNHIILKNYPVIGHFRYILESIRPEIQQYFIEEFDEGRPFSREYRSLVYQRSKKETDASPFGTLHNLYSNGVEWLNHTMKKVKELKSEPKVKIGNHQCKKPYMASRLNISAMSYGSISKTATESLNKGAKMGGFYHNTGEGGIAEYHLKGADIVWQIGTGYFGCRTDEGGFDEGLFKKEANKEQVKMIELKISQGAKPGHGGLLPAKKVSKEIAQIRKIDQGKDVHSPATHKEFDTPTEMVHFIKKLKDLSGGKPTGFKICIGNPKEFYSICKAIIQEDIYPDFITVDGAEGGTGAAPVEFANTVGTPLMDALNFVNNTLIETGIRDKVKIIASGKISDGFSILSKIALGADLCNSARSMMFALGCIQALRCHKNSCPTGIATTKASLYKGIDIEDKSERVRNYHTKTISQTLHLLSATGSEHFEDLKREIFMRRMPDNSIKSFEELYPLAKENALINATANKYNQKAWNEAKADTFS